MPTLDWLNREAAFRTAAAVPTRVLRPHAAGSRFGDGSDNLLVQGDNLEALKALLPFYRGQVKCIFIDPPYNTKSAFEHYDDNLEHSQWLSMMLPRLQLLRDFLRDDGSIWVTIDDNEGHYLKVLMDEVFGRGNFVANCVWQKRYSRENRSAIGDAHDHLFVYARHSETFKSVRNKLPLQEKQTKIYKNPNNDPRGLWRAVSLSAQGYRPNQMYVITAPNGKTHRPPAGSCWKIIEERYHELIANDLIYFGKNGNAVPARKQFLRSLSGILCAGHSMTRRSMYAYQQEDDQGGYGRSGGDAVDPQGTH
jgi:adenine-specific DNA-methyltransferase